MGIVVCDAVVYAQAAFKVLAWTDILVRIICIFFYFRRSFRISTTSNRKEFQGSYTRKKSSLRFMFHSNNDRDSTRKVTNLHIKSGFKKIVESNYVIAIATLSNWLKTFATLFETITTKTKASRTS